MHPLYCYDDHRGWGVELKTAATRRGFEAHLFTDAEAPPEGSLAFVHMHHSRAWKGEPDRRTIDKALMRRLGERGIATIPSQQQADLYDDKWLQYLAYHEMMPETHMIGDEDDAELALTALGLPLISKAREGAGSHNVRLVTTWSQAMAEVRQAFAPDEAGIKLRYGQRQRGYLMWQRFLPGNAFDFRVIRIGGRYLMLKRLNRPDRPMASGSGNHEPVLPTTDPAALEAFDTAFYFFMEYPGTQWCGVDLVFDHAAGRWLILETTVGWTMSGYAKCQFLNASGEPTGRTGAEVWDVLLDEIEAGRMA